MRSFRIGLAQINPTVGDFSGNLQLIRERLDEAREAGCAIVAVPELAVTGYPPEDLVLRRAFCLESRERVLELLDASRGIVAVIGFVDWVDGDPYNAAAILADGRWATTYHKRRLPNYGVFDEERYFATGQSLPVFKAGDLTFCVNICEDIWYPGQPLDAMALAGAELCVNINASPYHRNRIEERMRMLATRSVDNRIAVAYVNAVGGQDELVFEGASLFFDSEGELIARGPQFSECLVVCDIDLDEVAQRRLHDPRRRVELRERGGLDSAVIDLEFAPSVTTSEERAGTIEPLMGDEEELWQALVLGTRDYVAKTGFETALIGLSGGIDSALVAAIAVEALGPENVMGVGMPSRFSSDHSRTDAAVLAKSLGIEFAEISIEPAHAAMLEMLEEQFAGTEPGVAEENLQARQRGNVLMSISNKRRGSMVLTTGNKSEMATGYATLYGDMAGGFAVIKDVPKTAVFALARWLNESAGREVIPDSIITKPPSAELAPDQLDSDSLPSYDVLDPILEAYVEEDRTMAEIIAEGYDAATVRRVVTLVDRNEYKRRQAAPGVKITPRAFGRDRRLPLANRYWDESARD